MFERAIRDVEARLRARGLAHILEGVRGIRAVREESFHDSRTAVIGLNPADVRKPFAAFHTRSYLLVHELGHQFAQFSLSPAQRKGLSGLFGDYDARYVRLPRPRRCGADHVSRYAMTHPAEDFAETFAVCLWRAWDPRAVDRLLADRSPLCRRKEAAMRGFLAASAAAVRRGPPSEPGPSEPVAARG